MLSCCSFVFISSQIDGFKKPNKGKEAVPTSGNTVESLFHKRKTNGLLDVENKELFIDLALEQAKIGNRHGKGF